MPYEIENPRLFPGSISGLGVEVTEDGRVVNTKYGVRLDHTDGLLIEHPTPGNVTIAFTLEGAVEGTTDRVNGLYLFSPHGAVHIIGKLAEILARADPTYRHRLIDQLQQEETPQPAEPPAQPVPGSEAAEEAADAVYEDPDPTRPHFVPPVCAGDVLVAPLDDVAEAAAA